MTEYYDEYLDEITQKELRNNRTCAIIVPTEKIAHEFIRYIREGVFVRSMGIQSGMLSIRVDTTIVFGNPDFDQQELINRMTHLSLDPKQIKF